ncbi:MAG: hypothetical protein V2A54_07980 [Bacteroidota bacterium]
MEKENKNNNYKSTLKFSERSKITIKTKQKSIRYQGIITNITDSIVFVNGFPIYVSDIIFIKPNHNKLLRPSITSTAAGLVLLSTGVLIQNQNTYVSPAGALLLCTGGCVSIVFVPVLIGSLIWELTAPGYDTRRGAKIYVDTE